VAAIGNFDGVHLGHQAVLAETLSRARKASVRAVAITFDPHPVKVLHPGAAFACLETLPQRLRSLERTGIDDVVVARFDAALAATEARDFVESLLVGTVGIGALLVGRSFRFGRGRAGDTKLLAALGAERGFVPVTVEAVELEGAPVSSTRVRQALAAGEVELAARLLGRSFAVEGSVVSGAGRGKALGFPTANLRTDNECWPAPGVYATRARVASRELRAATFIGEALTFDVREAAIETHLIGYAGPELYGAKLTLEFRRRLRGPRKFADAEALKAQIAADLRQAEAD
jgi:riboflavin kinase/FMN adenylyltransferase